MNSEICIKFYHKIKSDNGARNVMAYSCFNSGHRKPNYTTYDSHVEMDIIYFKEMEGVYTVGNKDYPVKKGDVFIVRSNERHKITSVSEAGFIENIQFDPIFLWHDQDYYGLKFLSVFNSDIQDFANKVDRESHTYKIMRETFESMAEEFERAQQGFEQLVKMRMYIMLFTIARDMGYESVAGDSAVTPQIEAIRESMRYIEEHLCEQLTVPMLADVAKLSSNYYRTLFKQIAGISPIKYITAKRVNRAAKLLKTYEGNMLDLALECGFNSTASFNRAFRMYTGQVPSKYVSYVL